MSRAGRKRKAGRRHPNGELAKPYVNPRTLAAAQPHRRWLPEDKRLDQKADTVLGSLALVGEITEDQCLAGEEYARAVGRYRCVIAPPRGLLNGGRGFECDPSACTSDTETHCECRLRRSKYDELYEVLARAGRKTLTVVNCVVVHGLRISRGELVFVRGGLDALAKHLGLTNGRKSVTSRN